MEYALLKGKNGDAMLTVFDSGATKTVIMKKLIENGNIELIKWGRPTYVKGLNNTPTKAQEVEVVMYDQNGQGYQITAIIQNMIVQTVDKHPPQKLL